MKLQYNLEPFYTAIYLSRGDWNVGPKASTEVEVLVALQTALGENLGQRLGSVGLK